MGPGILPHHCNLMHTDGMVTVTPHGPDADTFVDGQRVTETTVLRSGSTLQFGSAHVFKFVDPMYDQGGKKEPGAMMRNRHKSGWEWRVIISSLWPPIPFFPFTLIFPLYYFSIHFQKSVHQKSIIVDKR